MSAVALDPVAAEAKRRARRRRLIALGVIVVVAAAAMGTVLATRSSSAGTLDAAARNQLPVIDVNDSGGGVIHALSLGFANGGDWLTNDGGQTWSLVPRAEVPPDPDFVDRRHGWIMKGHPIGLERTTDGGRTWQRLSLPGYTSVGHGLHFSMAPIVDGLAFVSPTAGFVEVAPFNFSREELFATTDGGVTWQPRVLPAGASLLQMVDARRGYAQGRGGVYYSTADGGQTWRVILRNKSFVPAQVLGRTLVGWTKATDPPSLYVTQDGGATWSSRRAPVGSLYAVNEHTWVVATPSKVFVTTSAGRRWRSAQLGVPAGWTAYQVGPFTSSRTGWAVFVRGTPGKNHDACQSPYACVLVRTTDGGRHWMPAGPPTPKGHSQ
jgi:photosystem II stability/assembly factor-like uncharacterized protein